MRAMLVLLVCCLSAAASACSCVYRGDTGSSRAQHALENYDLVFLADVSNIADTGSFQSNNVVRNATLTVTQVFKAPALAAFRVGATLATSTDLTCCLCGYQVSPTPHLIGIHRASSGPPYELSSCSINCAVGASVGCSDTVAALTPPSVRTSSATHSFGLPSRVVTVLLTLVAVLHTA
uniref:Leishmanolysin-like peptidase n=1 Tax=Neobodo designis TaxID=312471 RepID=A0A7S1Q6Z9_NEODS|mmetsp:Transcript_33684/g.103974  ORF Transcript_33684/g.103974 Transcript_33684/m.103974 type:complete len:179 (+) Transcript_33684:85-621(+)|eukprot:CAMPEP_0174864924 /NCGR_PEP_ID=MMETSP1114-20130205/59397_1 /TAXON_ID=312471 /ORGANISM="Neobodo designis, Strain CCAP 1951/1" /LENGTH=178 /DNA_ID=CAMNT_0016100041 /DNA_START=80 /DNA_END=616 /DNA_ORIENTATION=+